MAEATTTPTETDEARLARMTLDCEKGIAARPGADPAIINDTRWLLEMAGRGIRAALSSTSAPAGEEDGWCSDMSLAPKDGSHVDVWVSCPTHPDEKHREYRVADARFFFEANPPHDGFWVDRHINVIDWNGLEQHAFAKKVTHWRRPTAPAALSAPLQEGGSQ